MKYFKRAASGYFVDQLPLVFCSWFLKIRPALRMIANPPPVGDRGAFGDLPYPSVKLCLIRPSFLAAERRPGQVCSTY